MSIEQAFDKMMLGGTNEIDGIRETIRDYLNCDCTKDYLLEYTDLKECGICGYIGLEEDMHENDDDTYCDTCWEAR